ncbi:CK1 CK1 CK1-G kinase [Fusarium sp. NRRL 25303]|nr:CK1 CK1 CK1-G kinase [Fusarium sp. NRRL 25303]
MVVKLTYAIRQRPSVSVTEFQNRWRDYHGPLVSSFQTPLRLVKYTQAHRVPGDLDDSIRASRPHLSVQDEPPFNVVDEYVFDCSVDDFATFYYSEEGKSVWQTLVKDEEPYVDFQNSELLFVTEYNQVAASPGVDIIASEYNTTWLAFAFPQISPGSGIKHWVNNHAPLVRRWASVMGFEKYVQNHPYNDGAEVIKDMRKERGMKEAGNYSLYTSLWINGRTAHDQATIQAMAEIQADEHRGFIERGIRKVFGDIVFVSSSYYRSGILKLAMCRSVHRRQLFRQKRLTVARRESGISGLKYREIGEIKHETTIEDLCRGYPPDFCDGLRYIRGLDFEQEPDYDSLRRRLLQALKSSNGLTEDEDITDLQLRERFDVSAQKMPIARKNEPQNRRARTRSAKRVAIRGASGGAPGGNRSAPPTPDLPSPPVTVPNPAALSATPPVAAPVTCGGNAGGLEGLIGSLLGGLLGGA